MGKLAQSLFSVKRLINGADGLPATSINLVSSANAIHKNKGGVYYPTSFNVLRVLTVAGVGSELIGVDNALDYAHRNLWLNSEQVGGSSNVSGSGTPLFITDGDERYVRATPASSSNVSMFFPLFKTYFNNTYTFSCEVRHRFAGNVKCTFEETASFSKKFTEIPADVWVLMQSLPFVSKGGTHRAMLGTAGAAGIPIEYRKFTLNRVTTPGLAWQPAPEDSIILRNGISYTPGAVISSSSISTDLVFVLQVNSVSTTPLDTENIPFLLDGVNGESLYVTYNDSDVNTTPARPTGNGTLQGWHLDVRPTSVWMSQKVASSDISGTWSLPMLLRGENGGTVDFKYTKNTSPTTAPALVNNVRNPANWFSVPPTLLKGEFLWMIYAKISAKDVLVGTWSVPVRISGETGILGPLGLTGPDGLLGPSIAFAGVWDATKLYYGYADTQTCVTYNGRFYYTKAVAPAVSPVAIPKGEVNNPSTSAGLVYWASFNGQFDNVATDLLLANRIASSELSVNKIFIVDREETTGNIIAANGSKITKQEEAALTASAIIGRLTKGWYMDQGVIRSIAVNLTTGLPKVKLDQDGTITAVGVNITGTVNFVNGSIGNMSVFSDVEWKKTVNGPFPASKGFYYLRKTNGVTVTPEGNMIGKDYFLSGDTDQGPSVFVGDVYLPGGIVPGTDDTSLSAFLKLWNSLFERVIIGSNYYIKAKLPFFSVGEVLAYGNDNMSIPSIWDSIPVDGVTIGLIDGKLSTLTLASGGLTSVVLPAMGVADALSSAILDSTGTVLVFSAKTYVLGSDSRLTDSRNAKDVSAWAKAAAKPTYTFSEIGSKPTTISGYGITDAILNTDVRLTDARNAKDVYAWAKTASKPSYAYSEITGTPPATDLSNYVTLNSNQSISGRKAFATDVTATAFIKSGSTLGHVLLGNGDHKAINTLQVAHAATSDTWTTSRLLSLTGDIIGAGTINGDGDPTITADFRKVLITNIDSINKYDSAGIYHLGGNLTNYRSKLYTMIVTTDSAFHVVDLLVLGNISPGPSGVLGSHVDGAFNFLHRTYNIDSIGLSEAIPKGTWGLWKNIFDDYVKITDSRLSDARPASDVYAWAKTTTKPAYSYIEVGAEPAFAKNTAFNRNFGTVANTVARGDDARIINGQAAFSWGNHTAAGYATYPQLLLLKGSGLPTTEGYRDVTEIANTLLAFLTGADTDSTINKWKELETFLSGFTETDTLASALSAKADKSVSITAGTGLTGGGNLSANRVLSLLASGVTIGTYRSVTVDLYGRVISGSNPTTLSGYGITDAVATTDPRLTDARKASDVWGWAKALNKPTYRWLEIDEKPEWIGASKPSYSYSEITGTPPAVDTSTFVTISTEQTISGAKTFGDHIKYDMGSYALPISRGLIYYKSDILQGGIGMFGTDGVYSAAYVGVSNSPWNTNRLRIVTGAANFDIPVTATSFVKTGGTSLQLLRADGGVATFNWNGLSGQPTWLWGGNTQHTYQLYNPSNFRVANANTFADLTKDKFPREEAFITSPGWDANLKGNRIAFSYKNNAPANGTVLSVSSNGYGFQLHTAYSADSDLYYRRFGNPDDGGIGTWQKLATVAYTDSAFARADVKGAAGINLNSVNGWGIMTNSADVFATTANSYPINQAGTLFYGNAVSNSSCQIYGAYAANRWFVRGSGTGPANKTPWEELLKIGSADLRYLQLGGGTLTGPLIVNGVISSSSWLYNRTANFGLYNTVGDARWYWWSTANAWYADKAIISNSSIAASTQLISQGATGTAPLVVNSTTLVSNLNADMLDGNHGADYLSRIAYNYTNGVLVTLKSAAISAAMITVQIVGNAYSGRIPINTTIQFYNYPPENSIRAYHCVHNGHNFGNISAFNYEGKVCLWFKQDSNYHSYSIFATSTLGGSTNAIESISNVVKPTTGVTREVTIRPVVSALLTDNVASATKLQTPRTIFGQYFDGTNNVTGDLTAGNIQGDGNITANNGHLISTALGNTITIGSQNTSFCHFNSSADRPFHFNRGIYTEGLLSVKGVANITGAATFANRLTINSVGQILPSTTETRRAGLYGKYDAAKIAHIWGMGTSFQIADNGDNFGNLYGMAYKFTTNTTGGTMAGGHQIAFVSNGTAYASIGLAGGIWNNGAFNNLGAAAIGGALTINGVSTFKRDINVIGSESTTTRIKGPIGSAVNTAVSRYEVQWFSDYARFDVHRGASSKLDKFSWKYNDTEIASLKVDGKFSLMDLSTTGSISVGTNLYVNTIIPDPNNTSSPFSGMIGDIDNPFEIVVANRINAKTSLLAGPITSTGRSSIAGLSVGGYNNTTYGISTSTLICAGWLLTTGSSGWKNDTYGGGMYTDDQYSVKVIEDRKLVVQQTSSDSISTLGQVTSKGYNISGVPDADNYVLLAGGGKKLITSFTEWSAITGKPTTIAGYGITNAVLITDVRLTNARPASDVSAWAKAATKPTYTYTEVGAMRSLGRVVTNADDVAYIISGSYGMSGTVANLPTGLPYTAMLSVNNLDTGLQIVGGYSSNRLCFRGYGQNGGAMYPWREVLSDYNVYNYTPTKTGVGASGTWGINVTGNAATATSATYATSSSNFIAVHGTSIAGGYDVSTLIPTGGGYISQYGAGTYWKNAPAGMDYGSVLTIGSVGALTLRGQFAWDVKHGVADGTNRLWFRSSNNLGWNASWDRILTDRNYAEYGDKKYLSLNGGSLSGNLVVALRFSAQTIVKTGGTATQLLRADGGISSFYWSGNAGLPTWLWGGNAQHAYLLYNPANFNVNSASKLTTARSIWGTLFDGSANITGKIEFGNGYEIDPVDSLLKLGKTTGDGIILVDAIAGSTLAWGIDHVGGMTGDSLHTRKLTVTDECTLCKTVNMPDNARITTPGGALYLGNEDNSSYLFVQDIASQDGSSNWYINTSGSATFSTITARSNLLAPAANFANCSISSDLNVANAIYMTGGLRRIESKNGSIWNLLQFFNNYSNYTYGSDVFKLGMQMQSNGGLMLAMNQGLSGSFITWISDKKIHTQGSIIADGTITAKTTSDVRLKKNFNNIEANEILLSLGAIRSYEYNDTALNRKIAYSDKATHIGLVYQNVKDLFPLMAFMSEDGYGSLNYINTDYINLIAASALLTYLLVKDTRSLIERLEDKIKILEKDNEELKRIIAFKHSSSAEVN